MNKLSHTKEFYLLAVNDKGEIPALSREIHACLLAGSIVELIKEGMIATDRDYLFCFHICQLLETR